MASKTKLELAIERKSSELDDAQREIVKSQLSVYKRNRARMTTIEEKIKAIEAVKCATEGQAKELRSERASLTYEHGQIATANSRISAELFSMIGD